MSENQFEKIALEELTRLRMSVEEQAALAREPKWLVWIGSAILILTLVTTTVGIYDRFWTNQRQEELELRAELRGYMEGIGEINLKRVELADDLSKLQAFQGGTNNLRFSLAKRASDILSQSNVGASASEHLFVSETLLEFSEFETAFQLAEKAIDLADSFVESTSTRNHLASIRFQSPEHRDLALGRRLFEESWTQIVEAGSPSVAGNLTSLAQRWVVNEINYGHCDTANKTVARLDRHLERLERASPNWRRDLGSWVAEQNRSQERCSLSRP